MRALRRVVGPFMLVVDSTLDLALLRLWPECVSIDGPVKGLEVRASALKLTALLEASGGDDVRETVHVVRCMNAPLGSAQMQGTFRIFLMPKTVRLHFLLSHRFQCSSNG